MEDLIVYLLQNAGGITVEKIIDTLVTEYHYTPEFSRQDLRRRINYTLARYAKNVESKMGYLYWREDNE